MTFNRDLDSVQMWDVKSGLTYILEGRVSKDRKAVMQFYLTYDPNKTGNANGKKEKAEVDFNETLKNMLSDKDKIDEEPEESEQQEDEKNISVRVDMDILKPDEEDESLDLGEEYTRKLQRNTVAEHVKTKPGFDFIANKSSKDQSKAKMNNNRNAVHDFYQHGKRVEGSDMVPWGSIELIFNQKNLWANLQHQNPTKIMYELFDTKSWRPLLSVYENKKETPWLNKVGSFFHIANLESIFAPEKIHSIQNMILKDIRFTISCQRSGVNLESKFKSPKDKVTLMLEDYLRYLHTFETAKDTEAVIINRGQEFVKKIKENMPRDYVFWYLPLRFSIADTERIRSIISENFSHFFVSVPDPWMFAIAWKIFPYPNGVNSIRIIISYFARRQGDDMNEDEEDADDLDDEKNWDENSLDGDQMDRVLA